MRLYVFDLEISYGAGVAGVVAESEELARAVLRAYDGPNSYLAEGDITVCYAVEVADVPGMKFINGWEG